MIEVKVIDDKFVTKGSFDLGIAETYMNQLNPIRRKLRRSEIEYKRNGIEIEWYRRNGIEVKLHRRKMI